MSNHTCLRPPEINVNVSASTGTAAKIGECNIFFFPNWQLHHFRVDQIVQPGRKWLGSATCYSPYFTVKRRQDMLAPKQFILQIMNISFRVLFFFFCQSELSTYWFGNTRHHGVNESSSLAVFAACSCSSSSLLGLSLFFRECLNVPSDKK